MEALEATMKRHNVNVDSYSNSSSHGHEHFYSDFSFDALSTSSSNEWLIDSTTSYHMAKDKAIFSLLMNVRPNTYLLVIIYLLVL